MVAPWRNNLAKSKQKHNAPSQIMTIPKNWCRGGIVTPWRNTFVKSKQKHYAPSQNNDNSEKIIFLGVGVAWWHPEELPWLSRSRNIMPPSQMTIPKIGVWGGMVAPWRNTLAMSKQKQNAPSNNNSGKFWCRGGVVAPWKNTLAKSKQKHNAPSHNDNSGGKIVYGWHGGTLKKYLG